MTERRRVTCRKVVLVGFLPGNVSHSVNCSFSLRDMAKMWRVLTLAAVLGLVTMSRKVTSYGYNCPNKCVCRSSSVDCSNKDLDTIPTGIPKDTVKL